MENPLPPKCAAKFTPIQLIATGGFGAIYKANQIALDRLVAIKILHSDSLNDPDQRDRMIAEARITALLRHPNIVEIYECEVEDGVPWIAYEFLDGLSLASLIRMGTLPWRETFFIGTQVAQALEEAHRHGILHRDIKPDNVFRTRDGMHKVIDFGVAQWKSHRAIRTERGVVLGTPEYLDPAYIRRGLYLRQSDLYSLGILLFELVTGKPPFRGASPTEVILQHLSQNPPRPRELAPAIPMSGERIILKLLSKEPRDRHTSCSELLGDLSKVLHEEEISTPFDDSSSVQRMRDSVCVAEIDSTQMDRAPGLNRASPISPGVPESPPSTPVRLLPAVGLIAFFIVIFILGALFRRSADPKSPLSPSPKASPPRIQVFVRPARTLEVQILGAIPVRSVLSLGLSSSDGSKVTTDCHGPGSYFFNGLLADTPYRISLASGEGQLPTTSAVIRAPLRMALFNFSCLPGTDKVLIDFDFQGRFQYEIRIRRVVPGGPDIHHDYERNDFHHEIYRSLLPGSMYSVEISPKGSWGGLKAFSFRTLTEQEAFYGRDILGMLGSANSSMLSDEVSYDALASLKSIEVRGQIMKTIKAPGLDDSTRCNVSRVLCFLRDIELADLLVLHSAGWETRLTAAQRLIFLSGLLLSRHPMAHKWMTGALSTQSTCPNLPDPTKYDILRGLACQGGSEACSAAVRWFELCLDFDIAHGKWLAQYDPVQALDTFGRWTFRTDGLSPLGMVGLGLLARDEDADSLVQIACDDPHVGRRDDSTYSLVNSGNRRAILKALLRKPRDGVLVCAAGRLGLREALPILLNDLVFLEDQRFRENLDHADIVGMTSDLQALDKLRLVIIEALGLIGVPDARVSSALFKELQDPGLPWAETAAWALARLKSPGAARRIMTDMILKGRITAMVLWALGELRVEEARPHLREQIQRLKGSAVSGDRIKLSAALWALGRLGMKDEGSLVQSVLHERINGSFVAQVAENLLRKSPRQLQVFFPALRFDTICRAVWPEDWPVVEVFGGWKYPGSTASLADVRAPIEGPNLSGMTGLYVSMGNCRVPIGNERGKPIEREFPLHDGPRDLTIHCHRNYLRIPDDPMEGIVFFELSSSTSSRP